MQVLNKVLEGISIAAESVLPASTIAAVADVVPKVLKPVKPKPDFSKAPGYTLTDLKETEHGLTARLTRGDEGLVDIYGNDIKELQVVVEYQSEKRLHVHISDVSKTQFQITEHNFPRPATSSSPGNSDLVFNHESSPFGFWITRRSSPSTVLFDTRHHPLIFSDQYLQLSTSLPVSGNMYGPGEIVSSEGFRRSSTSSRTTLWNRDAGSPVDENIYGTHAFYLSSSPPPSGASGSGQNHQSFGVFLLNSHAMEIITNSHVLTYNLLGGTLDFYFLSGPTSMDVVRQHAEVVGKPVRMPYWAFGFHMCRWNGDWKTPEDVMKVIEIMKEQNIPLETVWTDLDYMDRYRDFESDPKTWSAKSYKALLDHLHKNKQHYVPIVDAGIAKPDAGDPYDAYDKGIELDVFVKGTDGKEYVGEVWPGDAVYPDWTAPNTQQWWKDCFDHYRQTVEYDGIWLDMNEPANFHMGSKRPNGDLKNKLDFPAYEITNGYDNFWDKTISPSAKLSDGTNHYHQHNLFGHQQNLATYKVLSEQMPNKRPFIITRSNFAGTGRVSGHWLGDNYSTWESMRHSIQGVLQFQLFHIPMVGADACGFSGECSEELANRWMQLAAFTPFYRNHNATDAPDQEPYRWKSVAEATKKVMKTRYQLLPYWETLFAQASRDGTPPIRPLMLEFDDPQLAAVDLQFMLGPDLLISPATHEDEEEVEGYWPEAGGVWRDWYTHKALKVDAKTKATITTPMGSINVHIRPGAIILIHSEAAYNLTDTRSADYGLIVSLNDQGEAKGMAILDDGLSVEGDSTTVSFSSSGFVLTVKSEGDYTKAPKLKKITVLGGGKGDEVREIDVDVDLAEGGEVKW